MEIAPGHKNEGYEVKKKKIKQEVWRSGKRMPASDLYLLL
jgi:hypothetical protein